MFARNVLDIGNANQAPQAFRWNFHWARRWSASRRRLWKGRRHGRVESHIALHFLHDLVNVAVEHRHRPKALEIGKRLSAIFGSPAPFGIHRPKRDVGENYDGRTAAPRFEILLNSSATSRWDYYDFAGWGAGPANGVDEVRRKDKGTRNGISSSSTNARA